MKHLFRKDRRMNPTRPPTILSPHGEGYCHHCRFVIGLDAQGLMDRHERGVNTTYSQNRAPCPGSGRKPHARTPYAAEKSRFKLVPAKGSCVHCGKRVSVHHDVYGNEYTAEHNGSNGARWCDGSYRPPA